MFHSFLLDRKSFLSRKANDSTKRLRARYQTNLGINLVRLGVLLSLFWILGSRVRFVPGRAVLLWDDKNLFGIGI